MARIQLVLRDGDKERYLCQAKRESMSLSAWLREAAQEKLDRDDEDSQRPFASVEELNSFFRECDALHEGEGPELDWGEYKQMIEDSKIAGLGIT